MTQPITVPPIVRDTVASALGERERRGGLHGMTRTAALVAAELAAAPVTTPDVVARVAEWHAANPTATRDDGSSSVLAGVWGGRAGRDWAMAMLAAAAPETGPEAAGLAIVAADTGRVLLLQRSLDPEDPAGGKWEWPGGHIDPGEGAYEAAQREFAEEVGFPPPGKLSGDWLSPNGVYHAFVQIVDREADVPLNMDLEDRATVNPDQDPDGDCIEVVAWWSVDDAEGNPVLRDEVRESTPWDELRIQQAKAAAVSDPLPILGRKPLAGDRLRSTSKRLAKVDDDLRKRLHAGAEVAMADGMRRAGVKVTQRAARKSKSVQASVAGCGDVFPCAVLAAVGITEQEALAHAFDSFASRAEGWIDAANRRRLAILADDLEMDADAKAKARKRWDAAKAVALGVLAAGLTRLAFNRLTGAHPFVEAEGEQSGDVLVPFGLVAEAVAAADGRPTLADDNGESVRVEVFGRGITHEVVTEQGIVLGIVTDQPVVEHLTWRWNDSEVPFPPHLNLDGTTATADNYREVWSKPETAFPYGVGWYAPGDHRGCRCSWDSSFEVVGESQPQAVAAALSVER